MGLDDQHKTKEQLISELNELRQKYDSLKTSCETTIQNDRILLETIINHIPSSVFVKDKNYRKLMANNAHLLRMRAHLKSIGLDPETNILGKTDFEVTTLKISQDYFTDDQKVIGDGISIINKEEEGVDPGGNIINLIISKVPLLDHKGDIIGMVGITSDITELRQVGEEVQRKNKQLIKSNAEKDKFFSIIAHDLKSPFNSILGFSELLLEQVREQDYNGIEEYAETILKASRRAVDLLMNLMYWARSQTGRIEFRPEIISLKCLFKETLLLFDDIAKQKNILIKRDLPEHIKVVADKAMISTVLRNLVSNAIKFTHSGGTIQISTEIIASEVLVSVIDDGIGISEGDLKKLFRIDENQSTLGTQNEEGTGLGLILCKEFIKKHDKKIWVESKKDKGSTFYFTLQLHT
jgi:signal transduction histidine kinase